MVLRIEQVRAIVKGAARVEERNGEFRFNRFTEAQTEVYRNCGNSDFYKKSFATSSIRLAFRTDSEKLSFTYRLEVGSSRSFGWFDLYLNGLLTNHFGTDGIQMTGGSVAIDLGKGEKCVELYLPWSRAAILSNIELDDGAMLEPISRPHTMIAFGDSITQGYDATYPSLSYASTLARLLDAEIFNKGIGGEIFFPALAEQADPIEPDYITVAYGTNDWSHSTPEEFTAHCRSFYQTLSALYPNAKIFAITPICRLDCERKTKFGAPTYTVDTRIRELCADLPNVTVICGWNFTPAFKTFYSDDHLHPNDLGFGLYAQNLYREIQKHL
ncbi:MAG: SGNH/GDSL hydrolase family protein [Ruminococcaceae bacterium]|nr:SGNH/GDSL hydrolase family protein [Oscillospiraceae bacterium]